MKTKIIPFDLETAKKIQAGEIEGKIIMDGDGIHKQETNCRILSIDSNCTDYKGIPHPLVVEYRKHNGVYEYDNFRKDGISIVPMRHHLVLEVPDNEPQFKPFDKVLVRNGMNCIWQPSIFSYQLGDCCYTVSSYPYEKENIIPYEGNEHLVGTTDKPKED